MEKDKVTMMGFFIPWKRMRSFGFVMYAGDMEK